MKICYIASAQSYYHPKCFRYFAERGHQVDVISVDRVRQPIPGVRVHCFPQFRFRVLRLAFTLLFGGILTKRIIARLKPDVLHAIEVDEGWCGARSGFHPFVMTPNGSDMLVYARKYALVRWIFRYVFHQADAVTSDSIPLRDGARALGAPDGANHIIQWGVDLNQFTPGVGGGGVREKHGLGDSSLVLSLRALKRNYNIDTVIRSIPEVLRGLPDVRFMFIHGFPDREREEELKSLAAELGVSRAVMFLDAVDYAAIPEYVAAATISVSVPSSDSSPRAVYEAMACGVPSVLSHIPWTEGLIEDEENALLVPVRDYQKLAVAILRLLSDEELRDRITRANFKLVDDKLNHHKHMARLEGIYESLCQPGRAKQPGKVLQG